MFKLCCLLLYNFCRMMWLRAAYAGRYKSSPIQRISPFAHIKIFDKGKIIIGRNLDIEAGCDIQVHGSGIIKVGDGTYMNRGCMISCHGNVSIGDGCMFGPDVKIFDNNHKFAKNSGVSPELKTGSVIIGNKCWIASNVILLKGANIGDYSVIGAGCVINSRIPKNSLVRNISELSIKPVD